MTEHEKTQISLVRVLIRSFFSIELYREIAQKWRGKGFAYLAFLCLVLMIPLSAWSLIKIDTYKQKLMKPVVKQLPQKMTLKDGQLSVKPSKKYSIDAPLFHTPFLIIDTSKQWPKSSLPDTVPATYMAKTGMLFQKGDQLYHIGYRHDLNFTVSPSNFWHQVRQFMFWIYVLEFIIVYIVGFAVLYLAYLLYTFMLTSFGSITAGLADFNMPFAKNWQLMLVAATPPTCLAFLLMLFNWLTLPLLALCIVVQLVYIVTVTIKVRHIFERKS